MLSDIFSTKIPGVKKSFNTVNNDADIVDDAKRRFNEGNTSENFDFMNMKPNVLKMDNFGNNEINSKIDMFNAGSNNTDFFNNKKDTRNEMVNKMDVYGLKIPGFNGFSGFERNARQHIKMKNPERIARNRIGNQRGLSMFGDYDGDGVANILDCKPKDFFKQGAVDRVRNLLGGRGFVDKPQPIQTPAGELEVFETEEKISPKIQIVDDSKIQDDTVQEDFGQKVIQGFTTVAEAAGKGFANIAQASGIKEVLEERRAEKEEIKGIRKEARAEALKEIEQEKVKTMVASEKKRILKKAGIPVPGEVPISQVLVRDKTGKVIGTRPRQPLREGIATFQGAVGQVSQDIYGGASRAIPVYRPLSAGDKINRALGMGPARRGYAEQITGAVGETPFSVKVDELLGEGDIARQWKAQQSKRQAFQRQLEVQRLTQPRVVQQVPQQPIQPQVVQPVAQPQVVQGNGAQFQPSVQKISPYSKRAVSYTRGPYRKAEKF
jgi:hypothetical protein